MLRKLLIGIAGVIVLLAFVIATRPAAFHIERSVTIAAPPQYAFALVNDFRAWQGWSPYEKLDPRMSKTYTGAPAGTGAVYTWSGSAQVGEGRMMIEQSEAPSLISIRLEFLKPFQATNTATFRFASAAEGSKVTWAMDGRNNFMAKAASLFMDMDELVGSDFQKGLSELKKAAESAAKANGSVANVAP